MIAGQAITLPSLGVLACSAGFVLAAVFFFIGYWQPTLRRRYGDSVRGCPHRFPVGRGSGVETISAGTDR